MVTAVSKSLPASKPWVSPRFWWSATSVSVTTGATDTSICRSISHTGVTISHTSLSLITGQPTPRLPRWATGWSGTRAPWNYMRGPTRILRLPRRMLQESGRLPSNVAQTMGKLRGLSIQSKSSSPPRWPVSRLYLRFPAWTTSRVL